MTKALPTEKSFFFFSLSKSFKNVPQQFISQLFPEQLQWTRPEEEDTISTGLEWKDRVDRVDVVHSTWGQHPRNIQQWLVLEWLLWSPTCHLRLAEGSSYEAWEVWALHTLPASSSMDFFIDPEKGWGPKGWECFGLCFHSEWLAIQWSNVFDRIQVMCFLRQVARTQETPLFSYSMKHLKFLHILTQK